MHYTTIDIKHDGAIAWLCLNRPQQLNAISPQMCDELQDYFANLQYNDDVRVVILRGAGRAFCAGYDLKDADQVNQGAITGMRTQRQVSEVFIRMRRCPQAIICLAHGAATGGGLAFALASDVRIASENVKFNVAMIKVGLTGCDVGISYFLPRCVGQSVAAEMMMTGRFVGADRALAIGLISEVTDRSQLEARGRAMAADMLKTSPMGLRMTKEGLRFAVDAPSLEAAVTMEDRGQILCADAGYFKEGIDAFVSGREPRYGEIK